jgi:hypothetical protein
MMKMLLLDEMLSELEREAGAGSGETGLEAGTGSAPGIGELGRDGDVSGEIDDDEDLVATATVTAVCLAV